MPRRLIRGFGGDKLSRKWSEWLESVCHRMSVLCEIVIGLQNEMSKTGRLGRGKRNWDERTRKTWKIKSIALGVVSVSDSKSVSWIISFWAEPLFQSNRMFAKIMFQNGWVEIVVASCFNRTVATHYTFFHTVFSQSQLEHLDRVGNLIKIGNSIHHHSHHHEYKSRKKNYGEITKKKWFSRSHNCISWEIGERVYLWDGLRDKEKMTVKG